MNEKRLRFVLCCTYKHSWSTKCQSFKDISSTTDTSIQEHRNTALYSFHNLNNIRVKVMCVKKNVQAFKQTQIPEDRRGERNQNKLGTSSRAIIVAGT